MVKKFESKTWQLIAFLLTLLTMFTVNSTCTLCLGQGEEPSSLQRFKKFNKKG